MAIKCDICGQRCENGTGLSAHRRNKHKGAPRQGDSGGRASRAAGAPTAASRPVPSGVIEGAIERLRQDRAELIANNRSVKLMQEQVADAQKKLDVLIADVPGISTIDAAIAALEPLRAKDPS